MVSCPISQSKSQDTETSLLMHQPARTSERAQNMHMTQPSAEAMAVTINTETRAAVHEELHLSAGVDDGRSTSKSTQWIEPTESQSQHQLGDRRESHRRVILGLLTLLTLVFLILSLVTYQRRDDDSQSETPVNLGEELARSFLHSIEKELVRKVSVMELFATQSSAAYERMVEMTTATTNSETATPTTSRRDQCHWSTLPDFDRVGSKLRLAANIDSITSLPVVPREDRDSWENYATMVITGGWHEMASGTTHESSSAATTNSSQNSLVFPDRIWDPQGINSSTTKTSNDYKYDLFLPLWQTSPMLKETSGYNVDMFHEPGLNEPFKKILDTGLPVLSFLVQPEGEEGTGSSHDVWHGFLRTNHDTSSEAGYEPSSRVLEIVGALYYPLNGKVYPLNSSTSTGWPCGVLLALFSWQSLMEMYCHTFPPTELFLIQIETSDGQSMLYHIQDQIVSYVDRWDNKENLVRELNSHVLLYQVDNFTHYFGGVALVPDQPFPIAGITVYFHSPTDKETKTIASIAFLTLGILALMGALAYFRHHFSHRMKGIGTIFFNNTSTTTDGETPGTKVKSDTEMSVLSSTPVRLSVEDRGPDEEAPESSHGETEQTTPDDDPNVIPLGSLRDSRHTAPASKRLLNYVKEQKETQSLLDDEQLKPMADFFPKCTVLFADIAGFAAWSSQHEPTQVFTFLQTLFQCFDKEARKHDVYKVESSGESYVAVTGIPEAQDDHAVRMCRFAFECRKNMKAVTKSLERTLGPEIRELGLRVGLHSGAVTAGVFHGERSRLQLFGDTVTTAARMQHTGLKNLIQISEATAMLLVEANLEKWVSERSEPVSIPGKGSITTYWIQNEGNQPAKQESCENNRRSTMSLLRKTTNSSFSLAASEDSYTIEHDGSGSPRRALRKSRSRVWGKSEVDVSGIPKRMLKKKSRRGTLQSRLIEWNVDVLLGLLKQVVYRRVSSPEEISTFDGRDLALRDKLNNGSTVVEEVKEIIPMPAFDPMIARHPFVDVEFITLEDEVEDQLRTYIATIASMYRDNPFHNYEHACHVQMAVLKLLQRVVSPTDVDYNGDMASVASTVHQYTYGITSDPLTQFAVVFCALIHDVDHTGVTNGQLVKEGAHLATVYKNKSVAEQNSIDLAWDLLMGDEYDALRNCIYTNIVEFKRFRQLVVNVVLATDIFDKELSTLRKNRWMKAFSDYSPDESHDDYVNRKATIVIEHLIQASDVSHTMQHWDIYRKWNEKLFCEMYISYHCGRHESDPSQGWYQGELWFFDNYVIPLAQKLKECGVFGVSSDECLNYAVENRNMWKTFGESIVQEMMQSESFIKLTERGKTSAKRLADKVAEVEP